MEIVDRYILWLLERKQKTEVETYVEQYGLTCRCTIYNYISWMKHAKNLTESTLTQALASAERGQDLVMSKYLLVISIVWIVIVTFVSQR